MIGNVKKGIFKRMSAVFGLVALVLVAAVRLPAQDSVEARLAALEGRIQELESELAVASYLRFAAGNFAFTPRFEYFNDPQRGQIRSYVAFA